jgi:hypothetical protein
MTGTVISVGRAKHRATLCPTSRIGRVTTLVCQQTKLVRTSPAITRRVSQECLSTVVERSGPFIDWELANLLPWQGRLRQCLCSPDRGGRVHWSNAEGLEAGALAGVDKVVLVREAKDSAIDAPLVEELAGVGVFVEYVGSACVDCQLHDVL